MNQSIQAQTRLEKICYKRLNSSDFAIKPTLIQRIMAFYPLARQRRSGGVA